MTTEEMDLKITEISGCLDEVRTNFIRHQHGSFGKANIGGTEYDYTLKAAHKTAIKTEYTAKLSELNTLIGELPAGTTL